MPTSGATEPTNTAATPAAPFVGAYLNYYWWKFPALAPRPNGLGGYLRRFAETLVYSFNVAALQKPEPLPGGIFAKIFVLLETFLGPLQAALLALAIRRRFMR